MIFNKFNRVAMEEPDTFLQLLETVVNSSCSIFDSRSLDNQTYYIVTFEMWIELILKMRRKSNNLLRYLNLDTDKVHELYLKCHSLISKLSVSKLTCSGLELDSLIQEQLKYLLDLYVIFSKFLEEIQIKCLQRFSFRTRQTPRLYIPFCYTLNKLSTDCICLEEDINSSNGYLTVQNGYIKDSVIRYKSTLPTINVISYVYNKSVHSLYVNSNNKLVQVDAPYLSDGWNYMKGRENEVQYKQRLQDVAFAYSNYKFIGYGTLDKVDNDDIHMTDTSITITPITDASKTDISKNFYINYPLVGVFNKNEINSISLFGKKEYRLVY